MSEYLTEQEQIDLLKTWLKQYSVVIISALIITALTILGFRWWQQRQTRTLTHASVIYDEMLTMRAQNDTPNTLLQAKHLFDRYPQTTYGQIAALMLARDALLKKDFKHGDSYLNWVISHSNNNSLREIARLRLARAYIARHQPQQALNLLKITDDLNFAGLREEIRGDAYLELNQPKSAQVAYSRALKLLPNPDSVRPLLRMKYDNITPLRYTFN